MTEEQKQVLETIDTVDIVKVLQNREGVKSITTGPYETITLTVNGPAVILEIID